jgi:hypothetical protein
MELASLRAPLTFDTGSDPALSGEYVVLSAHLDGTASAKGATVTVFITERLTTRLILQP